mmetsp:Transcript_3103/g.4750  ORF Transcript_3103/g.4750 Transcript_3103/m.4750 type:complete len:370 (+) Transcript_3103:83-1192(+)
MLYVPNWDMGGDTLVKKNFLRLTPDKPDQFGFVWSRQLLDSKDFSITWKIRISGDSKERYGNFLALSLTLDRKKSTGPIFGHREDFTGVMVIVDTNPMDRLNGRHFDVGVLTNNGKFDPHIRLNLQGCASGLRYYEGRDDFNILKSSRLRITYSDVSKMFSVAVDSRNTGRWMKCVDVDMSDKGLPPKWPAKAHVGLMASTKELTNNHDVLDLKVYSRTDEAEVNDKGLDDDEDIDDFSILMHHLEHELFDVHSSLQKTLSHLMKEESLAEDRIGQLERKLGKQVLAKIDRQMSVLEERITHTLDNAIENKIGRIENEIGVNFDIGLINQLTTVSTSWRVPFFVLSVAIMVVMYIVKRQLFQLSHTKHY